MKRVTGHGVFGATLLIALATMITSVAPVRAADEPAATVKPAALAADSAATGEVGKSVGSAADSTAAGQDVKPAETRPEPSMPAMKKTEQKAKAPEKEKVAKVPKVKPPRPPHNPEDPWDRGSTWLSVRAGYAKAKYDGSANGNIGGGFGFTHMFFHGWSLGGYALYDVLGRFGKAAESELPFTLEAARHLTWGPAFHPYFGFGGGTYYHKTYRTGDDNSVPHGGGYFVTGFNSPVSRHGLLGFDLRAGFVSGDPGKTNPVFGVQKAKSTRWSAKLNWSYTY